MNPRDRDEDLRCAFVERFDQTLLRQVISLI